MNVLILKSYHFTQQQVQRSPLPGGLQQMSPLSLVSHGATQNSHHRLLSNQQMGLLPNTMPEIERMMEYFKLMQQSTKEAARKLTPFLKNVKFEITTVINNGYFYIRSAKPRLHSCGYIECIGYVTNKPCRSLVNV